MATYILGISAFYHDSAAALIKDGEIIAAAQEERFTRKKHDPAFPVNAIKYCLEEAFLDISDIDTIAFYDKPWLKFERLLETYHVFSPRGLRSFILSMPLWIKEKLFQKRLIKDELKRLGKVTATLLFPEHHLSHAASAFYPSPFKEAAIVTIDGVGEWATTTISKGSGKDITLLKEIHFPHSLGLLYSAFTYFCGFKVNSGEYKLMGLAPYGDPESETTQYYIELIQTHLIDCRDDGSYVLNMDYFNYAVGLTMTVDAKWEALFGLKRRTSESDLGQDYMNLAYAIQAVTEDVVLKLAQHAKEISGSKNICLAGGVALNCVANGKLMKESLFDGIYIQPAAGDAGGALGAALSAWHIHGQEERSPSPTTLDSQKGSYLGPAYSDEMTRRQLDKYDAVYTHNEDFAILCQQTAKHLDDGLVVGWHQGRMEFGPRALGGRSILADPRKPDMQKKLNLKIKYREGFRPFAPSVIAEEAEKYFVLNGYDSPYMLLVTDVQPSLCHPLPEDYYQRSTYDRLYHLRSELPSITHVDYSARIQTVHQETNPRYHALISAFKDLTGTGVVVNTSFNVRGEPIVCTPEDAYRCFMRTEMDVLVIGNFILLKGDQPDFDDKEKWQETFQLD